MLLWHTTTCSMPIIFTCNVLESVIVNSECNSYREFCRAGVIQLVKDNNINKTVFKINAECQDIAIFQIGTLK